MEGEQDIKLRVEIRRNSDGAVAVSENEHVGWYQYQWENGNYSCDCNRELFFFRARGEEEPEDNDCGHTRYAVRIQSSKTGELLYSDWDERR